ncbi:MAG TPA: uracil-DNA glycosylase [Blastocatellia bacterium]|nr:uracil-DNA glycosylase [Blastocatellia bacterium]
MSERVVDETMAIIGEVKEQLKFYRDIGLEDIGGSTANAESAPAAGSAATIDPRHATEPPGLLDEHAYKQATQIVQAGLFGEVIPPIERGNSRPGSVLLPVVESRDQSLEAIRDDIGECRRCKLYEHRRTIVFGEGNPAAKLAFVGEGPGAEEDATGRPFVGRAGQLLDKIIGAIGLAREDVYIANIVKCRPPGNRTPERDEVETCEQFLFRQLAFIRPKVIVALGSPAFQCLLRTREPITRARGEWREWNGIKLMPTFHPAFLLRSPDKKREVWEDMKKVRDYLNLG